jgi:hypothetical protein
MDAATVRKVMDSNLASNSTGNSTGDGAVEEVNLGSLCSW